MCVLVNFVFLFVFTCSFTANAQWGRSFCTTPNGESAQCISIYRCPLLLNALKTRNRAAIDFIKDSICGNQQEFVCCGSYSEYINNDYDEQPPSQPQPQTNPWQNNFNNNNNNGGWGFPTNNNRPTSPSRPTSTRSGLIPDRSVCGPLSFGNRILNGNVTGIDEYPWMALLEYQNKNGRTAHSCGGMLISSRYVLTAAHCVTGEIEKVVGRIFRVRLGEWDLNTNPDCEENECSPPHQDVRVEQAFAHPGYDERDNSRHNDIAVVRLATPVKFITGFIEPICLPRNGDPTPKKYFVAGWGQTETGRNSHVKLKLQVPNYAQSRCQSTFRNLAVNIDRTQICAGGEANKDSCRGDSGGPLMFQHGNNWIAAGVVSFGVKCGTYDVPGVYTSVAEYLDWITENIRP